MVDWRFEPSAALGGDCFGYHWLDRDHFVLYVPDVSGHGVSASLLAVVILNVLRSRSLKHADFSDPGEVLDSLNHVFPMEEHNGMYFTMWYGVYQPSSRRLRYSSAGHPPALLFSRSGGGTIDVTRLQNPSLFVGGLPGIKYETSTISLTTPCTLYLFSDGVFEVADREGFFWGLNNFEELLARSVQADEPVLDRLMQHVQSLRQVSTLDDDLSIVEARFS